MALCCYEFGFSQCEPDQIELSVEIQTDVYGGETYWTLTDLSGDVVIQGGQGGVYGNNSLYVESICVPVDGCYFFEIWDTYGDGIFAPGGFWVYADNELVLTGADNINNYLQSTIHCPAACQMVENSLNALQSHITGESVLGGGALLEIRDVLLEFPECLASTESFVLLSKTIIDAYDSGFGHIWSLPETAYGFSKDPEANPGLELQHAMVALQQGVFDEVFTSGIYAQYPQHIEDWKFNSCVHFPGEVAAPEEPNNIISTLIRAQFQDPDGMNPYFDINNDGTNHALRPTGAYLAPGSIATVHVPEEMVGQDFWIRVGSHEWDLSNRPFYKRLDRISKKFSIDQTSIEVFNPLGGAISVLVPLGADLGDIQVDVAGAVEMPFFSITEHNPTTDFATELSKPAPWAVFESDNVMYSVPSHSIVSSPDELESALHDWETALRGVNSVMARQIVPDKHSMYMIADLTIRSGAFSIGYPMSNDALDFINTPGPAFFMNGPGPDDEVNFHETGHALAMSKFPGEIEAIVNLPYIMAMHHGLGEDLDEAVKFSFVPNTFDIDKTATHRLVSNTFGANRDISNTTTDEVRYQHRGYGHYFEIVNLFGWCPLRNFWRQEYVDFLNGVDHGINGQDSDGRLIRLCVAAQADLRPLLHVFGILPQDENAVDQALSEADIEPSFAVFERLQDYFSLIPQDGLAFENYALSVYPNLYTEGPTADPNYGIGWHYLRSLEYDAAEAAAREGILQDIVDLYYPFSPPDGSETENVCCTLNPLALSLDDGEVVVSGGVPPYAIENQISGSDSIVVVTDFDGCVITSAEMSNSFAIVDRYPMSIYPNPTSGTLQINLGEWQSSVLLNTFDAQGKLKDRQVLSSGQFFEYQLPNQAGIYALSIRFEDGSQQTLRVLKE